MKTKLYLDEDVKEAIAKALRQIGYDVLTTTEARNKGLSDEGQLQFAIAQARALLTHNQAHFARLHTSYMARGLEHYGIVISDQIGIKGIIRRLRKMLASLDAEEMINRLEYLSRWE